MKNKTPHSQIVPNYRVSRRRLFRDAGAVGAGLFLPGVLAACGSGGGSGSSNGGEGVELTFWEYKDPPNSEGWKFLEGAADRFQRDTGISVDLQFKSAEGIEQAVVAAANSKSGPDAWLWWSGPTVRDQASLSNVIALDDHLPEETWKHKTSLESVKYEGKHFAIPYVVYPWFLVYNRKILEKAGINADDVFPPADQEPPKWEAFLDVCDRVKTDAGVAPLVWANKEGYFNEWYFYLFEGQSFDSQAEIEKINLGSGSYQTQPIYDALEAYKHLYDNGYFVEGGEVVPYEQHVSQFAGGQAAMTLHFDMGGATAAAQKTQGLDAIGFSKVPAYRTDTKLYDHVSQEADALYVTSWSKHQDAAVKWIDFLMSLPEVEELARSTQTPSADDRLNPELFTDKGARQVYAGALEKSIVYPLAFATQAQYDSLLQNGILFLTGKWSAEKLTAEWDAVDKKYKAEQKKGSAAK